jgi:hypothetical protein
VGRAIRRRILVRTRTTQPPAPQIAAPTLGALRLVSPASDEIAFLGGVRVAPITDSVTSIGRARRNVIVLLDPSVSREHVKLIASRVGWWIETCSSNNTVEAAGKTLAPGHGTALAPVISVALVLQAMDLEEPVPGDQHLASDLARALE